MSDFVSDESALFEGRNDTAHPRTRQRRVFQGGASIRELFQQKRPTQPTPPSSAPIRHNCRPSPPPPATPPVLPPARVSFRYPPSGDYGDHDHTATVHSSTSGVSGETYRPVCITPTPPPGKGGITPLMTPPIQRRGVGIPSGLQVSLANPVGYFQQTQDEILDERTSGAAQTGEEVDRVGRYQMQLPVYSPRTMPTIIPLHAFVDVYTRHTSNNQQLHVTHSNNNVNTTDVSHASPLPAGAIRGGGSSKGAIGGVERLAPMLGGAASPNATQRSLGATHEKILRKSPYELTLRDLDNVDVVSDDDSSLAASEAATELDFNETSTTLAPKSITTDESMRRYNSYVSKLELAKLDLHAETELDKEMKLFERLANDEQFEEWLGLGQVKSFGAVIEEDEERRANAVTNTEQELDTRGSRSERAKKKREKQRKRQALLLGQKEDALSVYYHSISKSLLQKKALSPSPTRTTTTKSTASNSTPTSPSTRELQRQNHQAPPSQQKHKESNSLAASLSVSQRVLFSQAGILRRSDGEPREYNDNGDDSMSSTDSESPSRAPTSNKSTVFMGLSGTFGSTGAAGDSVAFGNSSQFLGPSPSTYCPSHNTHLVGIPTNNNQSSMMIMGSGGGRLVEPSGWFPPPNAEERALEVRVRAVRRVVAKMGMTQDDIPVPPNETRRDTRRRLRQQHPRRRGCAVPQSHHHQHHVDPSTTRRMFSQQELSDIARSVFEFRVPQSATEVPGGHGDEDYPLAPKDVIQGYIGVDDDSADPEVVDALPNYPPDISPLLATFRTWNVREVNARHQDLASLGPLPIRDMVVPVPSERATMVTTKVSLTPTANLGGSMILPRLEEGAEPPTSLTQFSPRRTDMFSQQLNTHRAKDVGSSSFGAMLDKKLSDLIRSDLFAHLNQAIVHMNSFCAPLTFEEFLQDAQACVEGVNADGYDSSLGGFKKLNADRLRLIPAPDTDSKSSAQQASVWVKGPILQRVPYIDRHNPNANIERKQLLRRAKAAKMDPADFAVQETASIAKKDHELDQTIRILSPGNGSTSVNAIVVGGSDVKASTPFDRAPPAFPPRRSLSAASSEEEELVPSEAVNTVPREMIAHVLPSNKHINNLPENDSAIPQDGGEVLGATSRHDTDIDFDMMSGVFSKTPPEEINMDRDEDAIVIDVPKVDSSISASQSYSYTNAAPPVRPSLIETRDDAIKHYDLDNKEAVEGGGWLTGTDNILIHVKEHILLTAHTLVTVTGEVERFLDTLMVFVNAQHAEDREDAEVRDGLLGGCIELKHFIANFNETVVKLESRVLEFEEFEGVRDAVENLTDSKIVPVEQVLEWMLANIPFPSQRDAITVVTSIPQLEELLSQRANSLDLNMVGSPSGSPRRASGQSAPVMVTVKPTIRGPPLVTMIPTPFTPSNQLHIPDDIRRLLKTMFVGNVKPPSSISRQQGGDLSEEVAGEREMGPAEVYAYAEGLLTRRAAVDPKSKSQAEPDGTFTITDHIAGMIGPLTNLLTEVAATSSPLLGLHRSWKESLLDGVYHRLAQINHLQETLSYGFIDPVLTRRLYDTDPHASANASNKFVQRAVARRRRNSLEQYMYERGDDNLDLLIERFAIGDTWLMKHNQEKADTRDNQSTGDPSCFSPQRTASTAVTPNPNAPQPSSGSPLSCKALLNSSVMLRGREGSPTENSSTANNRRRRSDATSASALQQQAQHPPVTLNSLTVAQFVRRLMCEYKCTPQQVAAKVKHFHSISAGVQLCLSSRYLVGEMGAEYDEAWGMTWVSHHPPLSKLLK